MATKDLVKEHIHYSRGLDEVRPIEAHKSIHLLRGHIRLATGIVADVTCTTCKRHIKQFVIS